MTRPDQALRKQMLERKEPMVISWTVQNVYSCSQGYLTRTGHMHYHISACAAIHDLISAALLLGSFRFLFVHDGEKLISLIALALS